MKKQHKRRNPFAYLLLHTSLFKSQIIKKKKKYDRKRDKNVKQYEKEE